MYFFGITKNPMTGNNYISCGDSSLVVVDNRYTLFNQFNIALENLIKQGAMYKIELLGIVCCNSINSNSVYCSVRVKNNTFEFSDITKNHFNDSILEAL